MYYLAVYRGDNWSEEWEHSDLSLLLRVQERLEADGAICDWWGW